MAGNKEGIAGFGKQLSDFASGLIRAYLLLNLIRDWSIFDKAAGVLTSFAVAASKIPNSGKSVSSFFSGDNDIGQFSEGLVTFAKNLKAYNDAIAPIKSWTNVIFSAVASAQLIKAFADVPTTSLDTKWFGADSDLEKFGEGIAAFAASQDVLR